MSSAITTAHDPNADAAATRHYSMMIQWDPKDRIYVVTIPELEGCMTHGSTYEDAVLQAQDAIETWLDAARADGDPIPPPHMRHR